MVALFRDTVRAGQRPGMSKPRWCDEPNLTKNATTGMVRYRTSRAPRTCNGRRPVTAAPDPLVTREQEVPYGRDPVEPFLLHARMATSGL